MKVFYAVVILFAVGLVGVAVWFSPLVSLGAPELYDDNVPVSTVRGLCYPSDALCRVDFKGDDGDMRQALDGLFAVTVKEVNIDGLTVVYAFSPRVAAQAQHLDSGEWYNVMAAYSDGKISIGTPILSGCY
ncbi:MAG: hypothetical protein J1F71_01330 [Clostridiales bacterium]|nr:hypothetical protein [Clostridiales bacterium]